MKKNVIVTILIVVIFVLGVVLGGICVYVYNANKDKDNTSQLSNVVNNNDNRSSNITQSEINNNLIDNSLTNQNTNTNEKNTSILYHGDEISIQPGISQYSYSLEVHNNEIIQKYDNKKYYNYEDSRYVCESIGTLVGVLGSYDGSGDIGTEVVGIVGNIARIATLNKLNNPFPREIAIIKGIEISPQLKDYNRIYKCDFDGDGKVEYLCFKKDIKTDNDGNFTGEKSNITVDLFDENYNLINHLITYNMNNVDSDFDLENVDIIDIDNDGKMEIFIDLFGWEERWFSCNI